MTNDIAETADPSHEGDPLDRFVAFEKLTGGHAHEWDQLRWFPHVKKSNSHPARPSVVFETRRMEPGEKAVPFVGRFGAFSRAVMSAADHRIGRPTIGPLRLMQEALQFLHAAIGGDDPDPASVTRETLDAAYDAMKASFTPQPANQRGSKLAWIAGLLDEHGICEPTEWECTFQSLGPRGGADKAFEPLTRAQFGAVAALSNMDLADEQDQLAQCVVDFMVVGGFRVGEAITLPRNCLHCEEVEGPDGAKVVRWGIWYWPEKVGPEECEVKPIPTAAVPIVKRALDRALALTDEPWKVARHLHLQQRTTLGDDWDGKPDDALLSDRDVQQVIGLTGDPERIGKFYIRRHRIPHTEVRGRTVTLHVKKADLLHHLWCRSDFQSCRHDLDFDVGLHELLFVRHVNGRRGTARKYAYKEVHRYLNGCSDCASIFVRNGMLENGEPISISPHSFRTTHETIAIRGGMSDIQQARMAGRTSMPVNLSYDGRDDEEKAEVLEGKYVQGGWSSAATLPDHVPMAPDESLVRPGMVAHCTSIGVCHHPYAKSPCPMYVEFVEAGFDDPGLAGDGAGRSRLAEEIDRQREAALATGPDVLGASRHAELCAAAASALRSGRERASLPGGRVGRGSQPRSRADGDAR